MASWAACTSVTDASAIAELRLLPGIEVGEVAGTLWLRGTELDAVKRVFSKVPAIQIFNVLESNQLRPITSRIPTGYLPALSWKPIRDVFSIRLPKSTLPGQSNQKMSIRLTRVCDERPADALLTGTRVWCDFAIVAPEARLARLRFASCENQESLILGFPLPSISGTRWVNRDGILSPCGFSWTPEIDASQLRQLFELASEDVVLMFEDNTHQIIRSEQFVTATRSGARQTVGESNHA